jgi:hypothetical protein
VSNARGIRHSWTGQRTGTSASYEGPLTRLVTVVEWVALAEWPETARLIALLAVMATAGALAAAAILAEIAAGLAELGASAPQSGKQLMAATRPSGGRLVPASPGCSGLERAARGGW